MTNKKSDLLGRIQKTIYIIIGSCVILVGFTTWTWKSFAEPIIKDQIKCEIKPIVQKIETIEELLVYQNIVHTVKADSTTKKEIQAVFQAWKRGKGK